MSTQPNNLIKVGQKPLGNYLQAIAIKFKQGASEVQLAGFGRSTERVMELARLAEALGLIADSPTFVKQNYRGTDGIIRTASGLRVTLRKVSKPE